MDLIEKPALVVHPHALVGDGTVTEAAAFLPNETLGAYIKRTGVNVPAGPVVVWHNGHRVPDALWRRLIPRMGDQVVIRARVLGGGGGGSKILRTVAMIALVVVAAYLGPVLGTALGFAGSTAAAVGSGLIMLGGALLINALLPPPTPTMAEFNQKKYEASPTYSISGGRNRMRRWEPMPVIFGRHKVIPDMGAQHYTEYVGNDQYLNQVFHFGLQAGRVDLTEFKIGDTPISNFQGVQIEVSGPDGKLSMFPGNVDTLQGFVVNQTDGWIARTTPVDTEFISIDLAAQLFRVNDDGGMATRTIDVEIQYRKVGAQSWSDVGTIQNWATHYWSLVSQTSTWYDDIWGGGWVYSDGFQIAYGSANKADHYDGEPGILSAGKDCSGLSGSAAQLCIALYMNGVWRWKPHPYALGQPWSGRAPNPLISTVPGIRISGAKQEPTRRTVSWDVPRGQYEIRVRKNTGDIKNSRESNEFAVGQIRCHQPDEADYTGQLRVALRIKATNQLNGAVDEFSAIAQARALVMVDGEPEDMPTRNPAWWFLHFAYGKRDESGRRIYGAGLDNSQIDYDAITAWAAWCNLKKLTFDYVLDVKRSSAEALQIIARAGRASPTWQTGKLGVVWDAADLPVTAMFGPFNIRAGTFKVDYINDGTADEIVLNFMNPERGWTLDEVRVAVPGATATNNPLQLDFDGCTDVGMAGREANLLAASQVWHRRRVSWETDIEGWVAGRGDVVQMSHDLTVWGYSGRLLGRDGNTITLDRHVPTAGTGTLMLRGPENQMKVVSVSSDIGDVDALTITADMAGFPLPGDEGYEDLAEMDWAWFFDPLETPGRRFKIVEVEPTEDGVKFSAIDDDPGYYASESNPYQYSPPRDGAYLGGVVFGITFAETLVSVAADISRVSVSWALSSSMLVDVAISINDVAQPVVQMMDRQTSIQAQTGDVVSVTVTPRPSRSSSGTPATQQYVVQGLASPLPAVTGLTNVFRDGLTVLVWNRVVDIRQPEYEIRLGETWDNSRTVAIVPTLETLAIGNGLYWVAARFAGRGHVVYGPPDSLQISGAALVRNVLLTQVEHPAWAGELGGGAVIHDGQLTLAGAGDILDAADVLPLADVLWFGGVTSRGTYQAQGAVDIGYVAPVRLSFDIDAYALNFSENMLAVEDVLAMEDVLNGSSAQYWRALPQIRHAGDDGVFGGWLAYTPGLINARHFEVRLVIETDDSMIVPFVSGFTWVVDVPDLVQQGTEITIPAAGARITYAKEFHMTPNVQIATFDATDGDRYELTKSNKTGFDIRLFNGDIAVQRQINWLSQGY